MNYKEEIQKILDRLAKSGIERGQIEEDFAYAENFIDQTLSRGGNKKFLAALKIYEKAMLQNATPPVAEKRLEKPSLETIQMALDKVLRRQILGRAEVRAFGEYQVMKDARNNKVVREEIMEQINRLVALNLGAISREGSSSDESN
jgi:hypothetical protein